MDKYSGKKLDGRYEIHELIGVGGMAMVYKAYDCIDNRVVAIKILKDEFSNNREFVRRFKNESKAIAVLSHPNIVKVYDVSFGDIIQYIVMEFIDGITLKEYIEQQNVISWKESVYFTTQILQALQHAHEKGIVHRDVKPQNIMLLQDGTIKVTDFGIARFSNTETRTMTDKAIGSVHYIAPEQARGDLTDAKSDVYSIGVMLYEMLTGKLPFQADNAVSVAIMQLQSRPKPLRQINPDIPEGLEEITLKAMRKEPSMRYQSAEEMLRDIDLFKENPSIKFDYEYLTEDTDADKYKNAIYESRGGNTGGDFEYDSKYQAAAEKKRSPAFNIIVGVVLSFLMVGILFFTLAAFQSCQNSKSDTVDIPNLVGQKISDVENDSKYNFTWDVINSYNPDQEEGVILRQEPEPSGKRVKSNSVITLTVNSKDTLVSVPYVNSEPEEIAVAMMKAKNLTPEVVYIYDDDTSEDIVRDTSPKAGSEIPVSQPVKLFIKKKAITTDITVPDLSGMSRDEAAVAIADAGLEFDFDYNTEVDKTKDSVIGQTPMPGTVLKEGETVKAYIAQGISKDKILKITTKLPTNITTPVFVRVRIDGVVSDEGSKELVPSQVKTIEIATKGATKESIVVDINGVIYRQYDINFETEDIVATKYDYSPTAPTDTSEPATDPIDPTVPTDATIPEE